MKRLISLFFVSLSVVSLMAGFAGISPVPVFAQDDVRNAVARLQDSSGNTVGSVSFTQIGAKVSIVTQVNNLPPGFHGFHVHSVGACDAAGELPFSSAGSHHDASVTHPGHAGDLPVLLVMADGTGLLTVVTDRFTVSSLLDADGSAVIVHANADNYANIPERYGITVDEQTTGTGDAGTRIACGIVQNASTAAAADNLAAIQVLPLDTLPATVSRAEGAETGTLVMTLPAMGNAQIVSQITSGAAGQIGQVTQEGDSLLFTFTEITYNVAPMELPGGFRIGPQTIQLDPTQTSTLAVNLTTGEITRNFHWLMTATDVLYNGQSSIILGDTAAAQVAGVTSPAANQYNLRLLTHWKSTISLTTWTISGTELPGGEIEATAEFDGIYLLDFNK